MRLPIVQFPNIVVDNLANFASVFSTEEQQKHFCEYVTGLIAGDKATITAINALFLNKNDQSALNKFITQAEWDEQELNRRRIQLELAYLRDHRLGHNVWAHNVVTSYYVNRSDQFPLDLRLYLQFNRPYEQRVRQKAAETWRSAATLANIRQYLAILLSQRYRQAAYRPKTQLGIELLQEAIAHGLPFSVVLFDSWYLPSPLVMAVQAAHKDWVAACPKDRNVLAGGQWQQVQAFTKTIPAEAYRPYRIGQHLFWAFTKVLPMKNLQRQRVRLVASYEDQVQVDKTPDFYATNR